MAWVGRKGAVPYDAFWAAIRTGRMIRGDNRQGLGASKVGRGSGLMRREEES